MEWQRQELGVVTDMSLDSDEIEYAMNIQICEMTLANPDF